MEIGEGRRMSVGLCRGEEVDARGEGKMGGEEGERGIEGKMGGDLIHLAGQNTSRP